jgi:hypothetical protein
MASRLRVRLHRLERAAQSALAAAQDGEPGEPRTEAEWIDRTGELLWQQFCLDKVSARGAEPAGGPDYLLAFRRAAEAVWAEGARPALPAGAPARGRRRGLCGGGAAPRARRPPLGLGRAGRADAAGGGIATAAL